VTLAVQEPVGVASILGHGAAPHRVASAESGSRRPGHSLGLPRSRIVADSIAVQCGRKNTVGAESVKVRNSLIMCG
jgi:hypothetical protein